MPSRVDEEKALVIRKSAQVHCGILERAGGSITDYSTHSGQDVAPSL